MKILYYSDEEVNSKSGSLANAENTIRDLLSLGHDVHHVYFREFRNTATLDNIVREFPESFSFGSLPHCDDLDFDVLWLTHLWHVDALVRGIQFVNSVSTNPRIYLVVFESLDFLFGHTRQITGDPLLRRRMFELERVLVKLSSFVLYITEEDRRAAVSCYSLDPSRALICKSYRLKRQSTDSDVSLRRVCMAGAAHAHNINSWEFALREIWPLVLKKDSGLCIDIFGTATAKLAGGLPPSRNLFFLGDVMDFQNQLGRYRAHLVPTVSGQGLKTKVLDSLAAGVPVVCSEKALEGIRNEVLPYKGKGVFVYHSSEEAARLLDTLASDDFLFLQSKAALLEFGSVTAGRSMNLDLYRNILGNDMMRPSVRLKSRVSDEKQLIHHFKVPGGHHLAIDSSHSPNIILLDLTESLLGDYELTDSIDDVALKRPWIVEIPYPFNFSDTDLLFSGGRLVISSTSSAQLAQFNLSVERLIRFVPTCGENFFFILPASGKDSYDGSLRRIILRYLNQEFGLQSNDSDLNTASMQNKDIDLLEKEDFENFLSNSLLRQTIYNYQKFRRLVEDHIERFPIACTSLPKAI